MGLTFPTGSSGTYNRSSQGTPNRARPCQCASYQLVDDDDLCARCGKYPKQTINATWAERARTIAQRNRAKEARKAA